MSEGNGTPERVAVLEGVSAAYEAEGYVLPNGLIDLAKVRERMFDVLAPRKVISKQERGSNAVTRGAMVGQIFPSLPGPDAFSEAEDPQLAQAIWDKIDTNLWGMATTSAGSALQRLIGINMGNGYVLCRTRITKDQTSAVYITDNSECIELDFIRPDNQALERKLRTVTKNREMLVYRQPHNAKRYGRRFDSVMKSITSAAMTQLAQAIESATDNGGEPAGAEEN